MISRLRGEEHRHPIPMPRPRVPSFGDPRGTTSRGRSAAVDRLLDQWDGSMSEIRKLLVANRGEIAIRVFRSAHELGIRTVAIYSHEDRFAIAPAQGRRGVRGRPARRADPQLPRTSRRSSRWPRRRRSTRSTPATASSRRTPSSPGPATRAGIAFVGPRPELLDLLGDKVAARRLAREAGVPVLSGSDDPVQPGPEAHALAESLGYPVIVKASMGGGGRGMRVVESADALDAAIDQARREAGTAFGVPDVFLEKFLRRAKHIEVQLLGDRHGNLVHLYERDCSVQRRHQKIIEIAPAPNLDPAIRQAICDAAVAIGRHVGYENAGTVEFLVDVDAGAVLLHRGQPAHPGRAHRHRDRHGHRPDQEPDPDRRRRAALRPRDRPARPGRRAGRRASPSSAGSRPRTPQNKFTPDYGRITHYRSAGGLGIRLDGGPAITGGIITPFYDSMLVKVSASGRRFIDAARRMERALQEFRVRGVKTNVPFLLNVVTHPDVPRRRLHDPVPRRDPRAVPVPGPAGPGDPAADASPPRSPSTASPA